MLRSFFLCSIIVISTSFTATSPTATFLFAETTLGIQPRVFGTGPSCPPPPAHCCKTCPLAHEEVVVSDLAADRLSKRF